MFKGVWIFDGLAYSVPILDVASKIADAGVEDVAH